MEALLRVSDLCFDYITEGSELNVINRVSFQVNHGDFISIVGPSGCGKSTLLDLMAGLIKPSGGEILFKGKKVEGPIKEIGYMLQKDQLFEWRTIYKNILLGPEIEGRRRQKKTAADEMLKKYELGSFSAAKPSQLSGGMRQRAALIRTLIMEPELLLLDEPFSSLDYQTRLMVCNDICRIIRSTKKTAILVTHDLAEAISTGSRVFIMGKRPSLIRRELVFDEEFARLSPLERRNNKSFNMYFQQLWEEFSYEKENDTK